MVAYEEFADGVAKRSLGQSEKDPFEVFKVSDGWRVVHIPVGTSMRFDEEHVARSIAASANALARAVAKKEEA